MNWAHFCRDCEFHNDCDIECPDAKAHQRRWWVRFIAWWQETWYEFKSYWSD